MTLISSEITCWITYTCSPHRSISPCPSLLHTHTPVLSLATWHEQIETYIRSSALSVLFPRVTSFAGITYSLTHVLTYLQNYTSVYPTSQPTEKKASVHLQRTVISVLSISLSLYINMTSTPSPLFMYMCTLFTICPALLPFPFLSLSVCLSVCVSLDFLLYEHSPRNAFGSWPFSFHSIPSHLISRLRV